MASLKKLIGGGYSLKVNDTELTLLQHAVESQRRANAEDVQVITDNTADQAMITEAINMRNRVLAELSQVMHAEAALDGH